MSLANGTKNNHPEFLENVKHPTSNEEECINQSINHSKIYEKNIDHQYIITMMMQCQQQLPSSNHWMCMLTTAARLATILSFLLLCSTHVVIQHSPFLALSYPFSTTTTTISGRCHLYHPQQDGTKAYRNCRILPRCISPFLLRSSSSSNDDTTMQLPSDDSTSTTITTTVVNQPSSHPPSHNHRSEIIKKHLLSLISKNDSDENDNNKNQNRNMNDAYGPVEVAAYQLFRSLRDLHASAIVPDVNPSSTTALLLLLFGMKGHPFVIRRSELEHVLPQSSHFVHMFTMNDLQQALEDDFLDAARGSTDPRTGWKV